MARDFCFFRSLHRYMDENSSIFKLSACTNLFLYIWIFIYISRIYIKNGGGKLSLHYFLKKKAVKILLPYIVVGSFLCILQHREFVQLLKGVSHLWFLLTIFECYFFFLYYQRIIYRTKQHIYISNLYLISICLLYPSISFF